MKNNHSRNRGVAFSAAVLVFAGFCAFAGIEAAGAPEPTPALRDVSSQHSDEARSPAVDHLNPQVEALATYTLGVMNDWPTAIVAHADYASIAHDIAEATLENPSPEPPADAILLAGLGFWEGARYADYVDKWECNDEEWRKTGFDNGSLHRPRERGRAFASETTFWLASELMHIGGDCDGGRAHGIWQIWFALDTSSPIYKFCSKAALSDRRSQARCALEIARSDMSLCGYAGENPGEGCPKGEQRRQFVLKALAKHPFTLLPKE